MTVHPPFHVEFHRYFIDPPPPVQDRTIYIYIPVDVFARRTGAKSERYDPTSQYKSTAGIHCTSFDTKYRTHTHIPAMLLLCCCASSARNTRTLYTYFVHTKDRSQTNMYVLA